ncbi:MAG TPA: FHA domain-containing protein [Candidatus Thermoplasmatota archaeon]|nr:FHA domain-containing protein [Candidatus Thermoplasmatota archaeon]
MSALASQAPRLHDASALAPPAARASAAQEGVEALSGYLRVLASDSRLSLLGLLRAPKTLDEILLSPSDVRDDPRPGRAVSRQAVQRHLDMLLEAGLVKRRLARRGVARAGYEYLLDHTRVFAVMEELRALTSYRSTMSADLVETQVAPSPGRASWGSGPKLVIVHGVREGHAFELPELAVGGAWRIGRAEDADATLAYDPYVSYENAEIVRTPTGYRLRDLRGAKNGTSLNWQRLPRGADVPLRSGDVIGVGRSLLLFRDG